MKICNSAKFAAIAAMLSILALSTSCGKDDDVIEIGFDEQEQPASTKGIVPIGQPLHVEGKFLKGPEGQTVNLHGFAQTYSPWFNHVDDYWPWNNYDVEGCLNCNKDKIAKMMSNGWCMDFCRLHMDPHWTVSGSGYDGEGKAHLFFDQAKFKKYLDEVFVPMAKYMESKGLRVVMRPPGVCPEVIALNDEYHKYLKTVWKIVAQHQYLRNNPNIMFELANEPVSFKSTSGQTAASGGSIDKELSQFFQEVVDLMRAEGCNNILWIPGTSWQQNYEAYKKYPIKGDNIGYAIHCYPGWYGSDCYQQTGEIAPDMWRGSEGGYTGFKKQFTASIMNTVGNSAPIIITEMDWASQKFKGRTWGSSITGVAGGKGFGANFKKIMDECGNVSWLTFAWDHDLANFNPKHATDSNDFLYDPESCVYPIYQWFKEYWEAAKAGSGE